MGTQTCPQLGKYHAKSSITTLWLVECDSPVRFFFVVCCQLLLVTRLLVLQTLALFVLYFFLCLYVSFIWRIATSHDRVDLASPPSVIYQSAAATTS